MASSEHFRPSLRSAHAGLMVKTLIVLSVALIQAASLAIEAVAVTDTNGTGAGHAGGSVECTGDNPITPTGSGWAGGDITLGLGPQGSYDVAGVRAAFVLADATDYKMWYVGVDGSRTRILYANSTDAITWVRHGVAIDVLQPPYNFDAASHVTVMKDGPMYKMWFAANYWSGGPAGVLGQVYYATSTDAVNWTIVGLALGLGAPGAWDDSMIVAPNVVLDVSGGYLLYYVGWDGEPGGFFNRIGLATSVDGRVFTRASADPIVDLGPAGSWDSGFLTTPFVIRSCPWQMWYAGSDGVGVRIGRATSRDGMHWQRAAGNPELTEGPPGSWDDRGVHAPQIVRFGPNLVFIYYTGYDGTNYRVGRSRWIPPLAE